MKNIGLRNKITIAIVFISLFIGVTISIFVHMIVTETLINEIKAKGILLTRNLASHSMNFILTDNIWELENLVKEEKEHDKDVAYAFIIDFRGKVLAHTFKDGFPVELKEANSLTMDQSRNIRILDIDGNLIYDIAVSVIIKNEIIGTARIGIYRKNIIKTINNTLFVISAITILAVIISVFIGFWLSGIIIKPIKELSAAAVEISKGKFDIKINFKSKDEIGTFVNIFNQMVYELNITTISKEYLDNIFESMNDILIVVNFDGTIKTINRAAEEILGYKENKLTGKPVRIIFAEEEEKEEELLFKGAGIKELIKKGSVSNIEKTYLTKEGKKIPVLFSGSVMRGADGEIQAVVCIASDITERKRTEEALRESEEKFRQIVEGSSDAFYRQNIKTAEYDYVSPKFFDLLGYKPEELKSMGIDEERKRIHPDDLPNLMNFPNDLIEADNRGERHIEREFRFKNKCGEYRWIHGNYALIRNEDGNPHLIGGSLKDITERKKAEEALKETNQSLEEMVYMSSHDLQSPLISMEGYTNELLSKYGDILDENGEYCLKRLKKNAHRMRMLIISSLDISKLSTKKYPFETFKPGNLVKEIVEDLTLTIERSNAGISIKKMPDIYGDKQRIEVVFRNLIVNAVDYEGKNIEVGYNGNKYYVKDDGIGIPGSQLNKIFMPGERLKIVETDGVGMGLTFCRKVINQHGGKIWVESNGSGNGSVFYFTIG